MKDKKELPDAVREYMSELGKKAGAVNKQKGSAYFKWVRSHGKTKNEKDSQKDVQKDES